MSDLKSLSNDTAVGSNTAQFIVPTPLPPSLPGEGFLLTSTFASQGVGDTPRMVDVDGGTSIWASTAAKISNERLYNGGNTLKCFIPQGDNSAFGEWGGIINYPENLVRGDSFWFRFKIFFDNSFVFNQSTGLKFVRGHTNKADGSNRGRNEWYFQEFKGEFSNYCNYEGSNYNDGVALPKDKLHRWGAHPELYPSSMKGRWVTYETQITLDHIYSDRGGFANRRCWIDGVLEYDSDFHSLGTQTLQSIDDYMDSIYLFTFWNGTTPADNTCYVADVVAQSLTPGSVDAAGNPYIGV